MSGDWGLSPSIVAEIKRVAQGIAHELWADLREGKINKIETEEIRSMVYSITGLTRADVLDLMEEHVARFVVDKVG